MDFHRNKTKKPSSVKVYYKTNW